MIQIIVNAFLEKEKTGAVVEVLYASSNYVKIKARFGGLAIQYPENNLAIYDLSLDTELNTLFHSQYESIGRGV
nr:hypothetical protein [Streptococcus pseudopneumoniae]